MDTVGHPVMNFTKARHALEDEFDTIRQITSKLDVAIQESFCAEIFDALSKIRLSAERLVVRNAVRDSRFSIWICNDIFNEDSILSIFQKFGAGWLNVEFVDGSESVGNDYLVIFRDLSAADNKEVLSMDCKEICTAMKIQPDESKIVIYDTTNYVEECVKNSTIGLKHIISEPEQDLVAVRKILQKLFIL